MTKVPVEVTFACLARHLRMGKPQTVARCRMGVALQVMETKTILPRHLATLTPDAPRVCLFGESASQRSICGCWTDLFGTKLAEAGQFRSSSSTRIATEAKTALTTVSQRF